jgi:hypothetical protein
MSRRMQQQVRKRGRFPLIFITHGTLMIDSPAPNSIQLARQVDTIRQPTQVVVVYWSLCAKQALLMHT